MAQSTRLIMAMLCSLGISACATLHYKLALDDGFSQNARHVPIKRPNWAFTGKAYNQSLGDYSAHNVDFASTRELDNKLVDGNIIDFNFSRFLYNGNIEFKRHKFYEISQRQRFTFDLIGENATAASSRCDIYQLQGRTERRKSRFSLRNAKIKKNKKVTELRLQTYVDCRIAHNGDQWTLLLMQDYENPPHPLLLRDGDAFDVSLTRNYQVFEQRKGVQRLRNVQSTSDNSYSGVTFNRGDTQLAAVSLLQISGIWLAGDISASDKEILLTAAYSMALFNWHDSQWQDRP